MLYKKIIFSVLLLLCLAALETVIVLGINRAPAYPDIALSPKKEAEIIKRGDISCSFQKVEISAPGTVCANFYLKVDGITDYRTLYCGILSEEEKRLCMSETSSARQIRNLIESKGTYELKYLVKRRFVMHRQNVSAPGVYYFAAAAKNDARLSPGDLYCFVTSTRIKLASVWPYFLIAVRNAILIVILIFLGYYFAKRLGAILRFAVIFLICGAVAALFAFTPENIIYAAKMGPMGRFLGHEIKTTELRGNSTAVSKIEELAPYATLLVRAKGHSSGGEKGLIFCDLFKLPSYDSDLAEELMSFWGDEPQEKYLVIDTVHSFQKQVSLRFFRFAFSENAAIDEYDFWELRLPPIIFKIILSFRNSLTPAFPTVWVCLFVGVLVIFLYFKRGLTSKLTVVFSTVCAIMMLFLPAYLFGREEAVIVRTPVRFYMAAEPLSYYAFLWQNLPSPNITEEELKTPKGGNFCIASFSEMIIGGADSLYPDYNRSFTRFFTHFYSGIKINVSADSVVMSDLKLVKLSPSLLIVKTVSWLWIISLILGGFFQIFKTILRKSDE